MLHTLNPFVELAEYITFYNINNMFLSDFVFFTFTIFLFVVLGLMASWEHIDHYTDWNKKVHTRLKGTLDDAPVVETTSVRYEPPTKLEAEEVKNKVIKLHSEKPNGTQIIEHQLIVRRPMSWGNCKELVGNRTEALYSQLSRLIPIINDTNYLLGYGSLLGLLRDGDMNTNEVDNDIMVDKGFNPSLAFKMKLMRQGLIIFKHDIWRVCDYSPKEVKNAKPPWYDRYVPYTDIYNQLPDIKPFPEKSIKIPGIWRPTWRKLRNITLRTPDREFAERWFYTRYGKTWRKPRVTDKWKINVVNG